MSAYCSTLRTIVTAAALTFASAFAQEGEKAPRIDTETTHQKIVEVLETPVQNEEERKTPEIDINSTLRKIAIVLRGSPVEAVVDEHLVDRPTKGFVQIAWDHFRYDQADDLFPALERSNEELLHAMQLLHEYPIAHFDTLLHEGFINGMEKVRLHQHETIHRELLTLLFRTRSRINRNFFNYPTQETIEREMGNPKIIRKPIWHTVQCYGNETRSVCVSPLARLGPGYVLSRQVRLKIIGAEDYEIDLKAEKADRNGDPMKFNKEREDYITTLIRKSDRSINYVLIGYKHNFTDDISESNKNHSEQISQIVVWVPSIRREEKK